MYLCHLSGALRNYTYYTKEDTGFSLAVDAQLMQAAKSRSGEACCSPHGWDAHQRRSRALQAHRWEIKLLNLAIYLITKR